MPYDVSVSNSSTPLDRDSLFRGAWLNGSVTTQSEKVVCVGILLIPVWWVIGWAYVPPLWVVGIAGYELYRHRRIRLGRPSLAVIALLLFMAYRTIAYMRNTPDFAFRSFIDPFLVWGCLALKLWYVQSHRIRVRLEVVAWAFSIVVGMMLMLWLFCWIGMREQPYLPLRTLIATLTGQNIYGAGALGSVGNFLTPYYFRDKGIFGLARYTLFFPHPTNASFTLGLIVLIALDLKKWWWKISIVGLGGFFIFIAQTRNAWIAFSLTLIVRWIIAVARTKGLAILLALLAIISFTTLSIPSVTESISDTYQQSIESTSNFRKDSTKVRSLIYQSTWESIPENPIFGHGVERSLHWAGYDYAQVGTESFILGTLLYKTGLLGTGFFLTFFIASLAQLYRTRRDRPLCIFMMVLYFSLAALVTDIDKPETFTMLLCFMISISMTNQTQTQSALSLRHS